MRTLMLCMLAACDLYWVSPQSHSGSGSGSGSSGCPSYGCSTCPFFEGAITARCTPPDSCQLETWEHGCSCSCTSDGWWSCFEETIGSHCPHPPVMDAGIDVLPDGPPPDAGVAACGVVEVEGIPTHPGWDIEYGTVDHGGEGLFGGIGGISFAFDFVGTGLVGYYEMGPNMGVFRVAVDGNTPVDVNTYRPNDFTFQNPTQVAGGLAYVQHTATVTCLSPYCSLDYFDVLCP
jgi:hypothetical protein